MTPFKAFLRISASIASVGMTFALFGCGPHPVKPPASSLSVGAFAVAAPNGDVAVHVAGTVHYRREMALSFRIPGVLTRLAVDDGDAIPKGRVIAALDSTDVAARLARADADLDRAQRDLDRLQGLVEKGAISRQQFEAQQTLLADAKAARQSAAFDRKWADLVAPSPGIVLHRVAQTGEVVQPGQTIVLMADVTSPMIVRAPISDRDITGLSLGKPVRISLSALPGKSFVGHITRIGQSASSDTGQIDIEAALPSVPGVRSGMLAELDMVRHAPGQEGVSRLPAEAVLEVNGHRAFVWRVEAGKAHRVEVRFSGFDGDFALIGGLAPGDHVITAGAGFVTEGQAVHVVGTVGGMPNPSGDLTGE